MAVIIKQELCVGCGLCLKFCPYDAIDLIDRMAIMNEQCVHCGACIDGCKFRAIVSVDEAVPPKDLSSYSGVMVFAEVRHEKLSKVGIELLGIARALADCRNSKVSAVIMGAKVSHLTRHLVEHGADKVFSIEDPSLEHYINGPFSRAFAIAIQQEKPEIVLVGATTIGRDLAPRVANRLKTGLTADCTELSIDQATGLLLQTRPAFGGNVMATITCPNHRPQMSTVRPGVMKPIPADPSRKGEIKTISVKLKERDLGVVLKEIMIDTAKKVDITQAEVIVAGGRGVGGAKGFEMLEQLARAFRGEVGASRAAVESSWIAHDHQVGQTGKSVGPRIYIACGISGAIQHLAGISGADYVIAINIDPNAPIMDRADVGIVGDLHQIVPMFISRLLDLRRENA